MRTRFALVHVLDRMSEYVNTGKPFYTFEEGCQDQYLDILIKKSAKEGVPVKTEAQPWHFTRLA